jgi:rhodanese-related sulfurtransferase
MAKERGWVALLIRDGIRAGYLFVACFLVGVLFNQFRNEGIPLVASEDYQVFVPCPETESEAEKVTLDDADADGNLAFPKDAILVDARTAESYAEGHIPGAENLPYDELDGVDPEAVSALAARVGAGQVIVYCDGWEEEEDPAARYDHPPSEYLADELKSAGIENVTSLTGGLAEYVKRGGELEVRSE